jgi:hypothetical protein
MPRAALFDTERSISLIKDSPLLIN